MCATDRRLAIKGFDIPRTPGHEIVGYLPDGTPVGVHPDIGCGRCQHCRAGFENRCPDRTSIGVDRDGGMAEWVAVPDEHLFPLEGVDVDVAALLEPFACCLHAMDILGVQPGEAALVVGAGPMGILGMWALQTAGARVVVAEPTGERRRLAEDLGAAGVAGTVEEATSRLGDRPTLALVTAPRASALAAALHTVEKGGRIHAFAGMPSGGNVDANPIHYRHLTVVGSTGSRLLDYQRAVALVEEDSVDLGRLPLKVVDLEAVPGILTASRRRPGAARVLAELDRKGGEVGRSQS